MFTLTHKHTQTHTHTFTQSINHSHPLPSPPISPFYESLPPLEEEEGKGTRKIHLTKDNVYKILLPIDVNTSLPNLFNNFVNNIYNQSFKSA